MSATRRWWVVNRDAGEGGRAPEKRAGRGVEQHRPRAGGALVDGEDAIHGGGLRCLAG